MLKRYLELGKVVTTHGIRGEVKLQLWCSGFDFAKQFKVVYLDREGQKPLKVVSMRAHKNDALVKFEGVENVENAEQLRNNVIFIDRNDAKIKKGEYFIQDIIGCKVVDIDSTEQIGTVSDVTNLGASDIYTVKRDGQEDVMIPVIADIVKKIDVENEVIEIKVMKGLFLDED